MRWPCRACCWRSAARCTLRRRIRRRPSCAVAMTPAAIASPGPATTDQALCCILRLRTGRRRAHSRPRRRFAVVRRRFRSMVAGSCSDGRSGARASASSGPAGRFARAAAPRLIFREARDLLNRIEHGSSHHETLPRLRRARRGRAFRHCRAGPGACVLRDPAGGPEHAPTRPSCACPTAATGQPTLKVRRPHSRGRRSTSSPMPKAGWALETRQGPALCAVVRAPESRHRGRTRDRLDGLARGRPFRRVRLPGADHGRGRGRHGLAISRSCRPAPTAPRHGPRSPAAGQDAHALKLPAPSGQDRGARRRAPQAVNVGRTSPSSSPGRGRRRPAPRWAAAICASPIRAGSRIGSSAAHSRSAGTGRAARDVPDRQRHAHEAGGGRARDQARRQTVELKPGGYHLMFVDLREGLKAGQIRQGHAGVREGRTVEVDGPGWERGPASAHWRCGRASAALSARRPAMILKRSLLLPLERLPGRGAHASRHAAAGLPDAPAGRRPRADRRAIRAHHAGRQAVHRARA